jgi:hypothetical protein
MGLLSLIGKTAEEMLFVVFEGIIRTDYQLRYKQLFDDAFFSGDVEATKLGLEKQSRIDWLTLSKFHKTPKWALKHLARREVEIEILRKNFTSGQFLEEYESVNNHILNMYCNYLKVFPEHEVLYRQGIIDILDNYAFPVEAGYADELLESLQRTGGISIRAYIEQLAGDERILGCDQEDYGTLFFNIVIQSNDTRAAFNQLAEYISTLNSPVKAPPALLNGYLLIIESVPELYGPECADATKVILSSWQDASLTKVLEAANVSDEFLQDAANFIEERIEENDYDDALDGEVLKSLYLKIAIKKNFVKRDSDREDKIVSILAERGDITPLKKEIDTSKANETQQLFYIDITKRVLFKLDPNTQQDVVPQFIDSIIDVGKNTTSQTVKSAASYLLFNSVPAIFLSEWEAMNSKSLKDIAPEIMPSAQTVLAAPVKTGKKLDSTEITLLRKVAENDPTKANETAKIFDKLMTEQFIKAQRCKDGGAPQKACRANVALLQENLLEIKSPTTVQIIQNWIRSGHLIGWDWDMEKFTATAADNLHNAYAQLIDGGKLSGESLGNAYIILACISERYPQYIEDTFNLTEARLLNRMPDPQQFNHGALYAMEIIGGNRDYAAKAFGILGDLMNQDIQDKVTIGQALTIMVQTTPALAPSAVQLFEVELADLPLDAGTSAEIFTYLTAIALSNEDTALDIVDLLEREYQRSPQAAKSALGTIAKEYPLFKNKINKIILTAQEFKL